MGLLDWIKDLFTSKKEVQKKEKEKERIQKVSEELYKGYTLYKSTPIVIQKQQETIPLKKKERDPIKLETNRLKRELKNRQLVEQAVLGLFLTSNDKSICDFFRGFKKFGTIYNGFIIDCSYYDNSKISRRFHTTQSHFKINDIKSIANLFTYALYCLRKKEYDILNSGNVEEKLVFYGTKYELVDDINKFNFDWRRHGESKENIFGQGASFTPISYDASKFCDIKMKSRYMLGVMMLKSKSCVGNENMIVPPEIDGSNVHYDTSEKKDGHVCVKYRDDEFYPCALIEFSDSSRKKIIDNTLYDVVN